MNRKGSTIYVLLFIVITFLTLSALLTFFRYSLIENYKEFEGGDTSSITTLNLILGVMFFSVQGVPLWISIIMDVTFIMGIAVVAFVLKGAG